MYKSKKRQHPYIAANLKYLRKQTGFSQAFTAESIEVNRSTYTKWETGICEPSLYMISKIIDFYNNLNIFDEIFDYNSILCEREEL